MNPTNQFIQIAPDCTRMAAIVPEDKGGKQSVAIIEYRLLTSKPYAYTLQTYTLQELKFAVHVLHKQIPPEEVEAHWQSFMLASPLTKKYGWGVHYDQLGKIAIYSVESKAYQRFVEDSNIKKYFALRNKRDDLTGRQVLVGHKTKLLVNG